MNPVAEITKTYPVEISGWDANDHFFVEKTLLEWKEGNPKTADLHCSVRVGCVLFIRLLRAGPIGTNFPVAYEAASVDKDGQSGAAQISLVQLQPRPATNGASYHERSVTRVA